MTKAYEDIIHLPRYVSRTRPRMAAIDRAAQFSPFAALTSHGAAIKETARVTDQRIELDEHMKNTLSNRLQIIADRLKEDHEIAITYFQPDEKKSGGAYVTVISRVKKIDEYERLVIMADGAQIPIEEIISIEGEVFETIVFDLCNE